MRHWDWARFYLRVPGVVGFASVASVARVYSPRFHMCFSLKKIFFLIFFSMRRRGNNTRNTRNTRKRREISLWYGGMVLWKECVVCYWGGRKDMPLHGHCII